MLPWLACRTQISVFTSSLCCVQVHPGLRQWSIPVRLWRRPQLQQPRRRGLLQQAGARLHRGLLRQHLPGCVGCIDCLEALQILGRNKSHTVRPHLMALTYSQPEEFEGCFGPSRPVPLFILHNADQRIYDHILSVNQRPLHGRGQPAAMAGQHHGSINTHTNKLDRSLHCC